MKINPRKCPLMSETPGSFSHYNFTNLKANLTCFWVHEIKSTWKFGNNGFGKWSSCLTWTTVYNPQVLTLQVWVLSRVRIKKGLKESFKSWASNMLKKSHYIIIPEK